MEYIPLFSILFVRIPVIIICLVAIGLGIVRWRMNPQVSLVVLIALVVLLLEALVGGLLSYVFPLMMTGQSEIEPIRTGYLVSVVGIIQGLLEAIAWGLVILLAVFGWRRQGDQKVESAA